MYIYIYIYIYIHTHTHIYDIYTDGQPQNVWKLLDQAGVAMGYKSLYSRANLPVWFLYTLAAVSAFNSYTLTNGYIPSYPIILHIY